MYVTEDDTDSERKVVRYVKRTSRLPDFTGVTFKQNRDPAAIFDFNGYRDDLLVLKLDVKIRDIASTDYPDYFISMEKYDEFRVGLCKYYMLYGFKKDRSILVFDLARCGITKRESQTIQHKRAGIPVTGPVYTVKAKDALETLFL